MGGFSFGFAWAFYPATPKSKAHRLKPALLKALVAI
jgi:hypothetical protein